MISLEALNYTNLCGSLIFGDISFTAFPGAIIKVVGSNGSGKTTFLRAIARLLKSYKGNIINLEENIAYIGHNLGIKEDLTVIEQLYFWAKIQDATILVPAALKMVSLESLSEIACYKLSTGNKQKLAIAKLLTTKSDLWILDEIDSALDDANTELLKNLILTKANNGGIIFYSSHRNILPYSFTLEV